MEHPYVCYDALQLTRIKLMLSQLIQILVKQPVQFSRDVKEILVAGISQEPAPGHYVSVLP